MDSKSKSLSMALWGFVIAVIPFGMFISPFIFLFGIISGIKEVMTVEKEKEANGINIKTLLGIILNSILLFCALAAAVIFFKFIV